MSPCVKELSLQQVGGICVNHLCLKQTYIFLPPRDCGGVLYSQSDSEHEDKPDPTADTNGYRQNPDSVTLGPTCQELEEQREARGGRRTSRKDTSGKQEAMGDGLTAERAERNSLKKKPPLPRNAKSAFS